MHNLVPRTTGQLQLFPNQSPARNTIVSGYFSPRYVRERFIPSDEESSRNIIPRKSIERFRCASISDFCMATDMLRLGYHHSIIPEHTSLSVKQTKLLWEKFKIEHPQECVQRQSSRNPTSLQIKNKNTKIHASILMQAYRSFGGQQVMQCVDIQSLNKAWDRYRKTVKQANIMDLKCGEITINQAWGLAKMLTDGKASFDYCENCQCWFFTPIDQQTTLHCPFCKG